MKYSTTNVQKLSLMCFSFVFLSYVILVTCKDVSTFLWPLLESWDPKNGVKPVLARALGDRN